MDSPLPNPTYPGPRQRKNKVRKPLESRSPVSDSPALPVHGSSVDEHRTDVAGIDDTKTNRIQGVGARGGGIQGGGKPRVETAPEDLRGCGIQGGGKERDEKDIQDLSPCESRACSPEPFNPHNAAFSLAQTPLKHEIPAETKVHIRSAGKAAPGLSNPGRRRPAGPRPMPGRTDPGRRRPAVPCPIPGRTDPACRRPAGPRPMPGSSIFIMPFSPHQSGDPTFDPQAVLFERIQRELNGN